MRLAFDEDGKHFYETGVSKGVLYRSARTTVHQPHPYPVGVAWNGLVSITETPTGAEETKIFADNDKYLSLRSAEELDGTIEAYSYPVEFAACDGSGYTAGLFLNGQTRETFGLCYRTIKGNDGAYNKYGYKLHLIYGATVSPSDRTYSTKNDSPEPITFSWDFSTIPVAVPGYKPVSVLIIDSRKAFPSRLEYVESLLYGTAETSPRLPLPEEIINIMSGTGYSSLVDEAVVGISVVGESA